MSTRVESRTIATVELPSNGDHDRAEDRPGRADESGVIAVLPRAADHRAHAL